MISRIGGAVFNLLLSPRDVQRSLRSAVVKLGMRLYPRRRTLLVLTSLVSLMLAVLLGYLVTEINPSGNLRLDHADTRLVASVVLLAVIVILLWLLLLDKVYPSDEAMAYFFNGTGLDIQSRKSALASQLKGSEDGTTELSAKHVFEHLLRTINTVADLLTSRVGDTCAVTVKVLVDPTDLTHDVRVTTLARDTRSSRVRKYDLEIDPFPYKKNTATRLLVEQPDLEYYLAEDLLALAANGQYDNVNLRWFDHYNKTLVFPLRSAGAAMESSIVGFLCIDCMNGSLSQPQIIRHVAWVPQHIYTTLGVIHALFAKEIEAKLIINRWGSSWHTLVVPGWNLARVGDGLVAASTSDDPKDRQAFARSLLRLRDDVFNEIRARERNVQRSDGISEIGGAIEDASGSGMSVRPPIEEAKLDIKSEEVKRTSVSRLRVTRGRDLDPLSIGWNEPPSVVSDDNIAQGVDANAIPQEVKTNQFVQLIAERQEQFYTAWQRKS